MSDNDREDTEPCYSAPIRDNSYFTPFLQRIYGQELKLPAALAEARSRAS